VRAGLAGRGGQQLRGVHVPPGHGRGAWTAGGRRYDDRLYLLVVDVDDTAEHRDWICHLKSHLLQRFEQLEIYVTSYPVQVH
jgi:hypothetical protein